MARRAAVLAAMMFACGAGGDAHVACPHTFCDDFDGENSLDDVRAHWGELDLGGGIAALVTDNVRSPPRALQVTLDATDGGPAERVGPRAVMVGPFMTLSCDFDVFIGAPTGPTSSASLVQVGFEDSSHATFTYAQFDLSTEYDAVWVSWTSAPGDGGSTHWSGGEVNVAWPSNAWSHVHVVLDRSQSTIQVNRQGAAPWTIIGVTFPSGAQNAFLRLGLTEIVQIQNDFVWPITFDNVVCDGQ
jgi:hypothetical protein